MVADVKLAVFHAVAPSSLLSRPAPFAKGLTSCTKHCPGFNVYE